MGYSKNDLRNLLDQAILAGSETESVEFKEGQGVELPNKLWRSISGFSHNPKGGVIFFGISEAKNTDRTLRPSSIPDLASLQEKIVSYFSEMMANAATPELHIIDYEGEKLLAVIVKPISDENKPCYYKRKGMQDGACIRIGNTTRTITQEELRQFIRNSTPFKFDRTPIASTSLEDLSLSKVKGFLDKSAARTGRYDVSGIEGMEQTLLNIGALAPEGFDPPVTVGGYLVFAKENPSLRPDFSRYSIRCVRYGGSSPSSPIIDKADISGTLDKQIEEAQHFIMKNIPLQARIVGTKRVEEYSYPEDAIREVVANAVIHRDYQMTGTYTQIAVYADRIEVFNPGNLAPGITVRNIKSAQFSRNEVIAQILKDMDYMEEYGRGIDIVYSRMHEKGLLEPIFKNEANSFRVILLGPRFSELNKRQVEIWHSLHELGVEGKITAVEYASKFNISRPSANADLVQMIDMGLLTKEGSGPNTHYRICF